MNEKTHEIITIVGKKQAREGFTFIHKGTPEKCGECRFRRVCVEKLESDRVYEVVKVREQQMPCLLHENGARVVEVEEVKVRTTVPIRQAFEGAVVAFEKRECNLTECEYYVLCHPPRLRPRDKCRIVKITEKITCPLETRNPLAIVLLRRIVH